jgi:hypothetical protein
MKISTFFVNGTEIAPENLPHNRPGRFGDATDAIPEELTRCKKRVTVKSQVQPHNFAGCGFGRGILRAARYR